MRNSLERVRVLRATFAAGFLTAAVSGPASADSVFSYMQNAPQFVVPPVHSQGYYSPPVNPPVANQYHGPSNSCDPFHGCNAASSGPGRTVGSTYPVPAPPSMSAPTYSVAPTTNYNPYFNLKPAVRKY